MMTIGSVYVVYASDDGFAEILGVSMESLFKNNEDLDEIQVSILDSGISEGNKERIKTICEKYHRALPIFLEAKDISQELNMEIATDRGSLSQYARLFIEQDLPKDLERVLYLDCDIIIAQPIRELWNLDMHDKTIAALNDAFSRYYRKNIDLEPEDVMFNSGVMLIDLKRWRALRIEQKLLRFIEKKHGRVQQGDQGALNAVLSHDVYCFHPRFNSVTIFYDFSYEELLVYRKPAGKYYSKAEIIESIEHPVIIHFTTSFLSQRPWVKGCRHRYNELWRKYKAESPWQEVPLRVDNRPGWKRKGIEAFKKLPRGLAIHIAGFLQAYGRPISNRF
jgi:lipopolysaccharide biosynthesis glycosyltransferase